MSAFQSSPRALPMHRMLTPRKPVTDEGEPTWEIAYLFPTQGNWCEEEYLALDTNHLVELSQGRLEVLPMPTMSHQLLVLHLYGLVLAFVSPQELGTVLVAPIPVRLSRGKTRE